MEYITIQDRRLKQYTRRVYQSKNILTVYCVVFTNNDN